MALDNLCHHLIPYRAGKVAILPQFLCLQLPFDLVKGGGKCQEEI